MPAPVKLKVDSICGTVFKSITYEDDDTEATKLQVRQHNAAYDSYCDVKDATSPTKPVPKSATAAEAARNAVVKQ